MLKGKSHEVLDTFKDGTAMRSRKPLGDDDADAAMEIAGIPVGLVQNVLMEWREPEAVLRRILATFWTFLVDSKG
jgi:hypothetical protein